MPTYEYHCNSCDQDMDIFQSIKEGHLALCPSCNVEGQFVRKISAGAGIIFKGSGFYETDYKNKSAPKSEKNDKSEKTPTTASADKKDSATSTDTKKSESKPNKAEAVAS